MHKNFRKIAKISLVLVYLVIAAGAIVRATGSGMGCPDWPKCFGYYIPPTDASQLAWQADHFYDKGQVIILDEALRVAKKDFSTSKTYSATHWEPYTKHAYALFNPWHTWIEFINRLFGALAGLATLVLAVASFGYWKQKKIITVLSVLTVFAMGFQAWLGATVVYSVLAPAKITIHMVMALIIVAMLLFLIQKTKEGEQHLRFRKPIYRLLVLAVFISLVQIVLGTQVRQFVDHQIDLVGESAKKLWLQDPTVTFYIHRSFSILVVVLNAFVAYKIINNAMGYQKIKWVLGLILLEIVSGMAMNYLDFPFSSQPVHLILATLLFGTQFYLVLEVFNTNRNAKTL